MTRQMVTRLKILTIVVAFLIAPLVGIASAMLSVLLF